MKKIVLVYMLLIGIAKGNVLDNKKYDILFKEEYNKRFSLYKDNYSWKIIKAQSIQESRLKKDARSPVGARGLMQIMPRTEDELKEQLNITMKDAALDPRKAIKMGVYYDKRIFVMWNAERSLEDRYKLMFASYNSGIGNMLKAQQRCLYYRRRYSEAMLECNKYDHIEWFLPEITGHHSKETIGYVKRIFRYYELLQ